MRGPESSKIHQHCELNASAGHGAQDIAAELDRVRREMVRILNAIDKQR